MTTELLIDAIGLIPEDVAADAKLGAPLPPRKSARPTAKRRLRRVALLAAAVSLFFTITAYALGVPAGVHSWTLSRGFGQDDFAFLPYYERQVGFPVRAVEAFSNGYRFREMTVMHSAVVDACGNPLKEYPGLLLDYEKMGAPELHLSAEPAALSDEHNAAPPTATRELDGVTAAYRQSAYLFVPEDYELSAEEAARAAAGELTVSYGSDAVQEQTVSSVIFCLDDTRYCLLTFAAYDADFMYQMVQELLATP